MCERGSDGALKDEVVGLVECVRIGGRRCEAEDLDSSVVAGSREVLVSWVEGNTLDMALMLRYRLQLLE